MVPSSQASHTGTLIRANVCVCVGGGGGYDDDDDDDECNETHKQMNCEADMKKLSSPHYYVDAAPLVLCRHHSVPWQRQSNFTLTKSSKQMHINERSAGKPKSVQVSSAVGALMLQP